MPELTATTSAQKQFFDENGYLVLEGFYTPAQIAEAKSRIDTIWAERRRPDNPLVIDAFIEDKVRERRVFFRDVDDAVRQFPYKLNDLHLVDPVIQEIVISSRLSNVLTDLLGARPVACNNLCFEFGSQQAAHFDTFYMPSPTPNMMCASWIALERVTETNGPLFYYPRSHLFPPHRFSNGGIAAVPEEMHEATRHITDLIATKQLERKTFMPNPGDVLIWHAQLLHGGGRILNRRETRRSLVTHYFTTVDYPREDQRIGLGDERYLYKRPHQFVRGDASEANIRSFLFHLRTPPEDKASVPEGFDPVGYLQKNQDVLNARGDPYTHFNRYGRNEGRQW